MTDKEKKDSLIVLVNNNRFDDFFKQISRLLDDDEAKREVNMLISYYDRIKKDSGIGLIKYEVKSSELNRITRLSLELIDSIFDGKTSGKEPKELIGSLNAVLKQVYRSRLFKRDVLLVMLAAFVLTLLFDYSTRHFSVVNDFFTEDLPMKTREFRRSMFSNLHLFDGGVIVTFTSLFLGIMSNSGVYRVYRSFWKWLNDRSNLFFIFFLVVPFFVFLFTANWLGLGVTVLFLVLFEKRSQKFLYQLKNKALGKKTWLLAFLIGLTFAYFLLYAVQNLPVKDRLLAAENQFLVIYETPFQSDDGGEGNRENQEMFFKHTKDVKTGTFQYYDSIKFYPEQFTDFNDVLLKKPEPSVLQAHMFNMTTKENQEVDYYLTPQFKIVDDTAYYVSIKRVVQVISGRDGKSARPVKGWTKYANPEHCVEEELPWVSLKIFYNFFVLCQEQKILNISEKDRKEICESFLTLYKTHLSQVYDSRREKALNLIKEIDRVLKRDELKRKEMLDLLNDYPRWFSMEKMIEQIEKDRKAAASLKKPFI